jgi:hypothetical protein
MGAAMTDHLEKNYQEIKRNRWADGKRSWVT